MVVVDDGPEMAALIADDLRQRGYRVSAVTSGRDALRLLRTERVHALVTDLRMPELDGLELLRRSQELDPSRPVIVMTAFETLDTAMEASEFGALHYIVKPFPVGRLARMLADVLRDRSS